MGGSWDRSRNQNAGGHLKGRRKGTGKELGDGPESSARKKGEAGAAAKHFFVFLFSLKKKK